MTEVVADGLATAIEVMLTSMIIAGIVVILSATQVINIRVTEQQAVASELREYRKHNQFDNTTVYQQDIISAIYKGRGEPVVYVKSSLGDYAWTLTNAPCNYTTSEISVLIDPLVIYSAQLRRGANGEVVGYEFVAKSGS